MRGTGVRGQSVRGQRVRHVIVVVPVHDEEELLRGCLAALESALARARLAGITCDAMIVLDDCTDGSVLIAQEYPFAIERVRAARVGAARAAGVAAGLAHLAALGPFDARAVWIANTDADSQVPENWIVAQCGLADRGADVVLGTVRPDFSDLSRRHRRHWLQTHVVGRPPGNVHGANLGIRADVYLAAGGFAPVPLHEDVELVARARRLGAAVCASDAAEVLTSGRHIGRTPGGYAEFVRVLAAELDREEVQTE